MTRFQAGQADTLASGAASPISGDRVGAVLANRFELLAHLGSGGMGSVYLAHDRQLDENVAIKLLHRQLAASQTLDLLRREVKLARRVTSTGVARIHELVEDAGEWFLTMEYIDGVPLADMIAGDGRLPVARVIELLGAVCDGLEAVHGAGVVHGDVKPANILVARDGRVVLSDFGIARFADVRGDAREVVGTPAYMAPEQVTGADLDHRADLYALGVVAFELLTGDLPFRGRNAIEVASARLIQDPPDVRERCADVSEGLAAAVMWLLARDPDARPDSAAAAREALSSIPAGAQSSMESVDVVDLYLKAQWLNRQLDRSGEAIEVFARACRQAPQSAMAHAGYASALTRRWMMVGTDDDNLAARARAAADRAMALGPQLGESHMARGSIALHLGQPVVAARAFRVAMTLAPGLADAHAIAASMMFEIGHLEAGTARLEIAERLDQALAWLWLARAQALALSGDSSAADALFAGDIQPGTVALMAAVRHYACCGDRDQLARLRAISGRGETGGQVAPSIFNGLAAVYAGDADLAAIYRKLPTESPGASLRRMAVAMQLRAEIACIYGDTRSAIEAIEIADQKGALIDRVWVERCPLLEPVRGSERFDAVAARIGDRALAVARAFKLAGATRSGSSPGA